MQLLILILLLLAGIVGFVLVQVKAHAAWRLLSIAVLLALSCWSCSRFTKMTTYHEVQNHYIRGGLPEFVGDIKTLSLAGRTNEVAHACDRFQKEFNIWYEGDSVSNFWDLVYETSQAANTTNKPQR